MRHRTRAQLHYDGVPARHTGALDLCPTTSRSQECGSAQMPRALHPASRPQRGEFTPLYAIAAGLLESAGAIMGE